MKFYCNCFLSSFPIVLQRFSESTDSSFLESLKSLEDEENDSVSEILQVQSKEFATIVDLEKGCFDIHLSFFLS